MIETRQYDSLLMFPNNKYAGYKCAHIAKPVTYGTVLDHIFDHDSKTFLSNFLKFLTNLEDARGEISCEFGDK